MKRKGSEYYQVEKVKNQIINSILIFGTILGILTFGFGLVSIKKTGFSITYITDFLNLVILYITFRLRNSISLKVRASIVILVILVYVFTSLHEYGIMGFNKILFILVPIIGFQAYGRKQTIWLFSVSLIGFAAYYAAFRSGILAPVIDMNKKALAPDAWIVNILLMSIVSFGVVIFMNRIFDSYNSLLNEMQVQNSELMKFREKLELMVIERTEELEAANEELRAINDELYEKNQKIIDQNSELKATMQNLKNTQAQLIQAEKMASIGVLTSGVAHEINNPLNYILGGYTGLKDYFIEKNPDEKVQFLLSSIKAGIDRASNIIRGLNQFSSNKERIKEPCNLMQILDNCLLMMNNMIENRIEIKRNFATDELIINGNLGKLHQAFINILINSIQSITGNGNIEISASEVNSDIIVSVTDSGCGISRENLVKVTDPFFTTKGYGKGVGLGLTIAYSIVKEHDGALEISSDIGKGTTVTVILPKMM